MHLTPYAEEQTGVCVDATSRYVPSYSTALEYDACEAGGCAAHFKLSNTSAAAVFARRWDLPEDPIWTETYNEVPSVSVSLRDDSAADAAILAGGLLATALAAAAVGLGRRSYFRQAHSHM
jgi:hypothetical protein